MFDPEQDRDWAKQVPEPQRKQPYEDYGWESGESVLPEFRKPEQHMNPDEIRRLERERRANWERSFPSEFIGRRPDRPGFNRGPFYGIGPQGFHRSDERILDDIAYRLLQHGGIDARDVVVEVKDGEVTLRGIVDNRRQKHMAEDVVESVMGVLNVNNDLKVRSMLRVTEDSSQKY